MTLGFNDPCDIIITVDIAELDRRASTSTSSGGTRARERALATIRRRLDRSEALFTQGPISPTETKYSLVGWFPVCIPTMGLITFGDVSTLPYTTLHYAT